MSNSTCTFMIDTGADISIFKLNKILPNHLINRDHRCMISGISGSKTETFASTHTSITFQGQHTVNHEFHLVEEHFPIFTDGILGRDFLTKFNCSIDYKSWILTFRHNNEEVTITIEDNINQGFILPERCEVVNKIEKLQATEDVLVCAEEIQPGIFCGNTLTTPSEKFVKFINTTEKPVLISNFKPTIIPLRNFIIANINPNVQISTRVEQINQKINASEIPEAAKPAFNELINQYNDIFALGEDNLSTNNFYTQNIELTDSVPVYIPNYRNIHAHNDEIEKQVKNMLNNDIIEHSVSAYNSPILLVPKKPNTTDKKWRLVVDYRQLNKKVLADRFPLPRIDSILDQLGRARFFSTLDLMAGFHQIPLDQQSRKFTAFSTTSGHYAFKRLPFGLNVSPNSFQRMMTIAMAGLTPECAFVYIDDIVVIGCSINHHLNNLKRVFERLRHYNLKLNPDKCFFFQDRTHLSRS